ncbi:MAG: hypothetical protein KGK07_17235, partial [Chloroflexota bacterium]|nr:hypothetical protein [Chloroflexota bacterium]
MLQLDGSRYTGALSAQNIADFIAAGIGRYVAGTEQGVGSTYTAEQLDACARGGLAKALYVYLDPARSASAQVVNGQDVAGQAVLDFLALDAEDEGYPADPSVVVPILQSARAAVRPGLPVWWYCGTS